MSSTEFYFSRRLWVYKLGGKKIPLKQNESVILKVLCIAI